MDCVGWAKALCAVPTILLKAGGLASLSPPTGPYHIFPASFLIAGLIDDAASS
jgi:hypothetical protein